MLTSNIDFKNFDIKRNSNKIKNLLKIFVKEDDQILNSLGKNYKNSFNKESLSSYLVRSGYGFAYRKYSKKFVKDEDYARVNKIGMWSMKFDYPWDYRKKN